MMIDPKTDEVEALLREASEMFIMPRFRALGDEEVVEKEGPMDLVTVADREAELFLTPQLEALVPGSKVIGEEAVSQGVTSADLLLEDRDLWLVDPVDGTYNFVQGSDRFGVMVAFLRGGQPVMSWILLPVDGRCVIAQKGAGALLGGEAMVPRRGVPFSQATGDYSRTYVDEPYRSIFDAGAAHSAGTHQGRCSAHGYTELARGLQDYFVQYIMTPWDHAPGQLIVEETGGRFALMPSGERYTPIPRENQPMLITADADVWQDYAHHLMAG
ncbi:MAG: inositol monophosphatase [Pseudomonadota bacterium]